MNINNTEGGVSPLKARQSSRGGKNASKATATGKRRGGYAKSKGKRGGGGRNVGGYNVNTRFKARGEWKPPASGGTAMSPPIIGGKLPEGYKKWIEGEKGTADRQETTESLKEGVGTWDYETQGSPTWVQAWDNNIENVNKKYEDIDEYIADQKAIRDGEYKGASKGEIKDSITKKTTVFIKGTDGKPGYYQHYDAAGNKTHTSTGSPAKKKKTKKTK